MTDRGIEVSRRALQVSLEGTVRALRIVAGNDNTSSLADLYAYRRGASELAANYRTIVKTMKRFNIRRVD